MHSVVNPWTACISQEAPARVVKLLSFGISAGLALIYLETKIHSKHYQNNENVLHNRDCYRKVSSDYGIVASKKQQSSPWWCVQR